MLRRNFMSLLPSSLLALFVKESPQEEMTYVKMGETILGIINGLVRYQKTKHGSEFWYDENFQLHRDNGPAAICSDRYWECVKQHSPGSKQWWQHGLLHREDGPAMIFNNGKKYWYLNHIMVKSHA